MFAPAFPIADLLDEDLCYLWLMRTRYRRPAGVYHQSVEPNGPVEDYRCKKCGGVFSVYTGRIFPRT